MKIKITSRSWTDEDGTSHSFQYYLLVQCIDTGQLCFEDYGVCIEDELHRITCIPSITTSAAHIDQLITLLVDHLVGPAGLEDVIADWL